jgi:hypothetical protein
VLTSPTARGDSQHRVTRWNGLHVGLFVGAPALDFGSHFFIKLVLDRFRQRGHSVSVITPQTSIPSGLDAGILHVAATRVPIKIVSRLPQHLPIMNRQALDISKRRISRMLVTSEDTDVGPVFVKSNANYAGRNDFARLGRGQKWIRRMAQLLLRKKQPIDAIPYRIYSSIAEVPRRIWADPRLVVERFIPELEGSLYCLRKWLFLGDTDILMIDRSNHPIVKAGESGQELIRDRVPKELVAERQRLGFDYGKFDYVIHEGQAVLLDANSTPGVGEPSQYHYVYADQLAIGLEEWMLARLARASESMEAG